MQQQAWARLAYPGAGTPEELVRLAYRAFANQDTQTLRAFCTGTIEVRPVDAFGLVGDTLSGFEAACRWVRHGAERGYQVTVWLRTLERVDDASVIGVGIVSERGSGCAATVAWIWHVRDGLIDSVLGFSSEAEARRSCGLAA
jgi:ketosteroid isomerase-like protein